MSFQRFIFGYCRGQGYDGPGSVSGHINGLSAHILRINRKAKNTLERVKELSIFSTCLKLDNSS